jgi:peroxiredoxin
MSDRVSCAQGLDLPVMLASDGSLNLAHFRGNKLVILFLGGHDANSAQREIESYDRLARQFENAGGWVIGIAGSGFAPAPERTPKDHVHIGVDADGAAFNALAARFPTVELDGRSGATILIDRDGVACQAWPGMGHAAEALTALRDRR